MKSFYPAVDPESSGMDRNGLRPSPKLCSAFRVHNGTPALDTQANHSMSFFSNWKGIDVKFVVAPMKALQLH